MFGIKTSLKNKLYNLEFILSNKDAIKFPTNPISVLKIKWFLYLIKKELQNLKKWRSLSDLFCYPNPIAISVWRKLLPYNPNHLGRWINRDIPPYKITGKIEKDLIYKMIDLYHADENKIEGYITSGATEGNIFSAWLGRKKLEQHMSIEQIILIRTDLTHYSIRKAADIVGIRDIVIPVNEDNWNMSITELEKSISKLWKKGIRGFLIPLTLGYTVGGTDDDTEEIIPLTRKLKDKFKNIYFFFWIDAALNGLTLPFIEKNFRPFNDEEIQSFVVDFHKFAGVPYPSGIILYRKDLRSLIEHSIPYLTETDNTLLGSRTGIAAVSTWITIQSLGKTGLREVLRACLERKKTVLNYIEDHYPEIKIISEKNSIQAALIVKKPLPESFSLKYGLQMIHYKIKFKRQSKLLKIYKLFFMPEY